MLIQPEDATVVRAHRLEASVPPLKPDVEDAHSRVGWRALSTVDEYWAYGSIVHGRNLFVIGSLRSFPNAFDEILTPGDRRGM